MTSNERHDRRRRPPPGKVGGMVRPIERLDHVKDRPGWACTTCGELWPCTVAQDRLIEEFRGFPSVLTIYMTAQMYDAVDDLVSGGCVVPDDLFERFLAWAHKAAPHQDGAERVDLDSLSKVEPKRAVIG